MLVLLLTLLTPALADDGPAPPPQEGTLEHTVWKTLSQRHDPGCDEVLTQGETAAVHAALVTVAETADAPPWAGVRAAACLTRKLGADEASGPVLERWVTEGQWSGLGYAVLQELDALPEDRAVALGTKALQRSDERFVRRAVRALADSSHATVRALPEQLATSAEP